MKVSIIDWIVRKLKRCIGIVEDGDTASTAISKGKYVVWKGNLYTADSAISAGTTLAASGGSKNLTAVSEGAANSLLAVTDSLNSNINDYHTNSSTSTYASWDVKYSIVGRVCTFIFGFTPSTNISSSIGSIGDTGLPNPASTDYVCIYPVTKVQQSYALADTQNRFGGVKNIGSSNAEVRAVGAYESGVKYSFCGSYVIAS